MRENTLHRISKAIRVKLYTVQHNCLGYTIWEESTTVHRIDVMIINSGNKNNDDNDNYQATTPNHVAMYFGLKTPMIQITAPSPPPSLSFQAIRFALILWFRCKSVRGRKRLINWRPGTEAQNACPFKQQSFYGHLIVCLLLFCNSATWSFIEYAWEHGFRCNSECPWMSLRFCNWRVEFLESEIRYGADLFGFR